MIDVIGRVEEEAWNGFPRTPQPHIKETTKQIPGRLINTQHVPAQWTHMFSHNGSLLSTDEEMQRLHLAFEELNFEESERDRKLFVGGLSWTTTEDVLQNYFQSLKIPVEKVSIMRDKLTGRSRGFGFVTLRNPQHVDKALLSYLYLEGRRIEAKRAIPKQDMDNPAKKIFVGGISLNLSNTDFRKYFETFGTVLETQVMTDRDTGRSRGFGFVTFEDENVTIEVLKRRHEILGKQVEVKRAEPKKSEFQSSINLMHPMNHQGVYLSNPFQYPTAIVYNNQPKMYRQQSLDNAHFGSAPIVGRANSSFRSELDNEVNWSISDRTTNRVDKLINDSRAEWEQLQLQSRNTFEHINSVRTERAHSDGIIPLDYSENISNQIRKKRGASMPNTRNSLIIKPSKFDNTWRNFEEINGNYYQNNRISHYPSNKSSPLLSEKIQNEAYFHENESIPCDLKKKTYNLFF